MSSRSGCSYRKLGPCWRSRNSPTLCLPERRTGRVLANRLVKTEGADQERFVRRISVTGGEGDLIEVQTAPTISADGVVEMPRQMLPLKQPLHVVAYSLAGGSSADSDSELRSEVGPDGRFTLRGLYGPRLHRIACP